MIAFHDRRGERRSYSSDDVVEAGNDPFPKEWLGNRSMKLTHVSVHAVGRGKDWPDEPEDHEQVRSIIKQGPETMPPILLGSRNEEGKYPLWDGGHRLRAHLIAGRSHIKAFVPQ
jgi:hypothetical protein